MLGYYHGRKVSSDTRIENILNSKVTHTSVGRYLRETYSGNNRVSYEQVLSNNIAKENINCSKLYYIYYSE